ncbi:MAG: DNA polymerase beta superfamily protein [Planctomycetota bacterium]
MNELLIYSVGTQVVVQKETLHAKERIAHPAGSVAVVIRSPLDRAHSYCVRFSDGFEAQVHHDQLVRLAEFQRSAIRPNASTHTTSGLFDRVIYRCVIGSRAYGLDDEQSDTDRRGFYLPQAQMHWSLYGVPEQLENDATQEAYWELQKFIVLALKANPHVLECLYSPFVEFATPLAQELLSIRKVFLSKLVFQTYSGYVASQFKKMQSDIRNQGRVKWKHVMHLIRLLISGTDVLREGELTVKVRDQREQLFAIKQGEWTFAQADSYRKQLQVEFERAFEKTALPDRPDYERANMFLIDARRRALQEELP